MTHSSGGNLSEGFAQVGKSRDLQKFVPEIPFSVIEIKWRRERKLFLLTSPNPSAILK